ncbi:hypothetical protein [Roseobacter ponti]|uniref:Uncharacterized protein n=1 Tax=Roseobacter ponti TaxID=1891787 RepID=A0A858SU52_9RHOB|nr:hypothetical protein [Roseobacter ponti]QJF50416.1 hypothetical protein G3256_04175 [Roseobacter ponti]
MPAVFLSGWTALRAAGMPEATAFVWAAVLAQAAQVWGTLPGTVRLQRRVFGQARPAFLRAMTMILGVLAFQIWYADPSFSQRLISIFCAAYAGLMVLGVRGDTDILDRFVPVTDDTRVPMSFRRHLLMLYALVAIMVIAVNETLVVLDTPLNTRVVALSLLPLALHYFFEIALRLSCPPLEDDEA